MPELKNTKHELFAQNISKGLSEYESYKLAGYEGKNEDSLRGSASRLRSNAIVASRISELVKTGAEQALVEITDVVKGFLRIAGADLSDAFQEDGRTLKPLKEMPRDLRLAIQSIEVDEIIDRESQTVIGYTKKIKLCDKKGSWDSLARYLKMFVEKHELSLSKSLEDLIIDSRKSE